MKNFILFLLVVFLASCEKDLSEADFYKNLYTGDVYNKNEFENFRQGLLDKYSDSVQKPFVKFYFINREQIGDSTQINFKYDVRLDDQYLIRAKEFKKIGQLLPARTFISIEGKEVVVGGKQDKPTLINLWFINCPGCIAEIPALNKLQEKYKNKVNFIALTWQKEQKIRDFLKKKSFDFIHIAAQDPYIKKIGSYPFPENIFIDKNGYITHIEGGIPIFEKLDIEQSIEHFELIIDKLLQPKQIP